MDLLSPHLHYASFGRRVIAVIIDFIVLIIPGFLAQIVLPVVGPILIWFLYSPILEASEFRATVGKHMAGIQVVDLTGGTITLKTAYIRYLAKHILFVLFIFEVLFALFTSRSQTLHDLMADTIVVYGRKEGSLWDAWIQGIKDLFERFGPKSSGSSTTNPRPESTSSQLEQIEKLQKLKESGALTEEEFQEQKKKILSRL